MSTPPVKVPSPADLWRLCNDLVSVVLRGPVSFDDKWISERDKLIEHFLANYVPPVGTMQALGKTDEPTDEELWEFQDEWFNSSDSKEIDVTAFQRATLARFGNRQSTSDLS